MLRTHTLFPGDVRARRGCGPGNAGESVEGRENVGEGVW